MTRNPYCREDETKPPFEWGTRVSVFMNYRQSRLVGTVQGCSWNDEGSDTGWWVNVLLDDDPGPGQSLADRPRLPGRSARSTVVTASECRRIDTPAVRPHQET